MTEQAAAMDRYRTMRFEVFEVWENGGGEFPLFICSDSTMVREYVEDNPGDTFTRRWWTREGPFGQAVT